MDSVTALLDKLEGKILEISADYRKVRLENDLLLNQITELKNTILEQKTELEQLEAQIRMLKVSKSLGSGEGSQKAKEKIDALVREIDRCIGLLSN